MELFILKILDGALGTLKSIFLYRNRYLMSALFSAVSTAFYFKMVVNLIKSNDTNAGIYIISLATFLGAYLPPIILERFEKDKVWIFNVTPDTNNRGKVFADSIRNNNIPVLTYKGFNGKKEQVVCSKIFSYNKDHSKTIESMIPEGFKFHVIELKNNISL